MNAPTATHLEVRDLGFHYESATVLDHCSFSVKPQERLIIMRSSGSGKSTLLRLILGLIQPGTGSIRFDDRDIADLSSEELNALRGKIGMVYQSAALISSLSVRDNMALPLKELTESTPEEIEKIVDEKLALVGMQDTKAQLPSELSGGMRKRIGLARALVLEPELILFDEPSSGLDPVNASLIDELIVDVCDKTKASCIVVTHNMPSAFRIATRMAMLHNGRVLEEDAPETFRQSKNAIVHQFITGDPKGPLTQEHGHETSAK
jgi:phospholipid/cholesterol/gamma-HCH transport system ATP-binding protein